MPLEDGTRLGPYEILAQAGAGGMGEVYKENIFSQDILKDGSIVAINLQGFTIFLLPPGASKLQPLLESKFAKDEPHVSPDGKWIAYNSMESGRWEVHTAAFPSFTEKRQISSGGGCQPLWRKDGKELYYLTLDGNMVAVDVRAGANGIESGAPKTLFKTKIRVAPTYDQYRVIGDGRFVLVEPAGDSTQTLTVVANATPGPRH